MKVIILCGGSGARLWPLSRRAYPKQFVKLADMRHSIFQLTVKRALEMGEIQDIYFVTNEKYRYLIRSQMEELGILSIEENILCEPEPKSTLPAITFAVKQLQSDDVAIVLSSDHLIDNDKVLINTVQSAAPYTKDHIVIFGIPAKTPETVYGYIKPGEPKGQGFLVESFVEKPDLPTAKQYVERGYLWNSGMFMFRVDVFMREVKTYAKEVYDAFSQPDVEQSFAKTPNISMDNGLLEKNQNNIVFPMSVGWNDLGNFIAFYDKYRADVTGNVSFHDEIILEGTHNLVYSEGEKAIALVGVSDMVVVDQKDALLICDRHQTSKVRDVVTELRKRKDKRADVHVTEYRPWGSFTMLEKRTAYQVKRLTVSPGKRLSSQMHYHRNEHWVVVHGTAIVEIDGQEKILYSGESIYVKAGHQHRLSNPGKIVLEVIEIQSGAYLEEDDIIRYKDDYDR